MTLCSETPNCETRIDAYLSNRVDELRTLWNLHRRNPEAQDPELGRLQDFGLALDYVTQEHHPDIKEPYFRYQLSTGGPGDEFRFFVVEREPDRKLRAVRVEYAFLDWYDGAKQELNGADRDLLISIWDGFLSQIVDPLAVRIGTIVSFPLG